MTSRRAFVLSTLLTASGTALAADPSFSLKTEVAPAKKGERTVVKVVLAPGSGYHVNKDFPLALALTAPAGVTLEHDKLVAKDAARLEEAGAEFDVALTSSAAGKQVVSGELKFAVCSASSCDPKREKVSFTVDVK